MKKYLAIILMFSLVLVFTFTSSTKINAAQEEIEKEVGYIAIVKESIKNTVGNIEDYGSFHIEHTNGKKYVIALSKEDAKTDKLKQLLKKQFPADLLEIRTGYKYPYSELFRVNSELGKNWKELNSDGTQIVETYADEINDKVVINASSMTDATRERLIKQYGNIIEIVVSSENQQASGTAFGRKENMTTLGAGIGIQTNHSTSCSTAGYGTMGGVKYIITAGHCLYNANGTSVITQWSNNVGVEHYSGFFNGSGEDIGLVKITDATRSISNLVLKNGTTGYDATITSTGTITAGAAICKAGITTNYTCSTVFAATSNVMFTINSSTQTIVDTIKINNSNFTFNQSGDSGGITWAGQNLLGIMTANSPSPATTSSYAYATKIGYLTSLYPTFSIQLS